jgi:hypothetical protein
MRFALWPNLAQPWADALALARHADATGWNGVYIAEIAGADQKLLGGVAEFTPADDLPKGSHARAVGPNDRAARATLTSLLSHSPSTRAESC